MQYISHITQDKITKERQFAWHVKREKKIKITEHRVKHLEEVEITDKLQASKIYFLVM